jgi:hypothetical protein
LASERREVEVCPGTAHRLVAAVVHEIRAEHAVARADERVGTVPLVHAEVGVEVVGDRVPGDRLPTHPSFQALDVLLRRPRGVNERRIARIQVREMGGLVGHERAADAGMVGPAGYAGLVKGAVYDQLAATVEEVDEARPTLGPLECVLLVHGLPRHPASLGGERVTRVSQLLLFYEQSLTRGLPLLPRHDRRRLHCGVSLHLWSSWVRSTSPPLDLL